MKCPNCGSICDDNLIFCSKCGTKINTFDSDIAATPIDKTRDDILDVINIEKGKEDTGNLYGKNSKNKNISLIKDEDNIDLIEDDFEDSFINNSNKRHNYKSTSQSYLKNNLKKKKLGKKKVALIALLTVVMIVASVLVTLIVKTAILTNKYNKFFEQGEAYYKEQKYEPAKAQYILASKNAFTKSQKIESYEKVYELDEILGNYLDEQINYLELLIDVDDENIEYYKDLIVLYQNNDMDAKIDPLIADAPSSIRDELKEFGGTIPIADIKEGTYDKPIEVKLSVSEDVKIYYTLDGSDPTDSSTKKRYKDPINLSTEGTYTLRAYSVDSNDRASKDCSYKYVLQFKTITPPTINLKSGEYDTEQTIKVTAPSGCKIYYTTDGTTPTKKSKLYKNSIKMPKGNNVYYFVAIDNEGISSKVVTRAYNYYPNKISYDQAVNSLKDYLCERGDMENSLGEFENGDAGYLTYKETTEISDEQFYIIQFEIEDKDGKNVSSTSYAVSCETGKISKTGKSGDSYSLD